MAYQSPMISIPRKSTDEVDWTTPIRNLIAKSYGESPDSYATECAALQRCRQDAVRGAGSDSTARDLLYKYFGQLELLELRLSEIRVSFPWRDAFTSKLTTQTSIAFEKASILFQIASVHSSLATSQSRGDPEGIKRAFYYFRTCAGMLNYINDNFLHAPSTDLSREVVKFLINVILAQATEVFFEKCTEEKKGPALVSKVGAQAAGLYTALSEQVKEFMGKGIFDRNWVTLIQVKSKYFVSLSNYYRAQADDAAGKHGEALVRYNLAETNAKEASRLAGTFASSFSPTLSPTLPPDAGSSIVERLKAHLSLCTDRRSEAQRENDLIYNAVLPNADSLPTIEKLVVATPIPIQEVYGTPDVQKTIGQDIFIRLVPLSVHESASVYSEEKAKLVRGEVERAEMAESEAQSALDVMGVKDGLTKFKAMLAEAEDDGQAGFAFVGSNSDDLVIPSSVRRWKTDISLIESREPVSTLLGQLATNKSKVQSILQNTSVLLENESRECEVMRVKYQEKWVQDPSAGYTRGMREDLRSHMGTLEAAAKSDEQVGALWESVRQDIGLLIGANGRREGELEELFRRAAAGGTSGTEASPEDLLDLVDGDQRDADEEMEKEERARIGGMIAEIDERLGKLGKISRERNEILKDLKDKIQSDDVSHLLLLNRRNSSVEPALFSAELEKFHPFQQRLSATVHHQEACLQEIAAFWKKLTREVSGGGGGASKGNGFFRKWEEREKRKKEAVGRFERAREGYMEVKDGLAKGLNFYAELTSVTETLHQNAAEYVKKRTEEREGLVKQLEIERRLSSSVSTVGVTGSGAPPPLPPPRPSNDIGLNSSMASMNLGSGGGRSQQQPSYQHPSFPPTPPSQPPSRTSQSAASYSSSSPGTGFPPPPSQRPQPPRNPSMSPSQFPLPPPLQHSSYGQPSALPGAGSPPPSHDPYASLGSLGMFGVGSTPAPPPSQHHYSYGGPSTPSAPPPPPQPGYNPNPNYQNQQSEYSYRADFPPPSAPQYQSKNPATAPGYAGYVSPAPPQQQQQQQPPFPQGGHHYQGFPPPPPSQPQQQQQQQQSYGGGYGGYGAGYGR